MNEEAVSTRRTYERAIERHPILHDFSVHGDVITERNSRNVPVMIKREEHCQYCPTRRFTRIDVRRWLVVGSRQYKYDKGVAIVRMPKAEWLKQEFIASTKLTGKDLEALS
jgi:hypothetical protein